MLSVKNKRFLVTGGAGFLGLALTERLLDMGCKNIRIFSRDEHKHEEMMSALGKKGYDPDSLRYILGDVRDTDLLRYSLRDVDYVVHAAALKIIPTGQYNPLEFASVNYGGWVSVVKAVLDSNKRIKVIGVSTDKSVEPLSTYGKAKALGEDLFIHANVYSPEMKFSCVRYGNVVDSTSSLLAVMKSYNLPKLTHMEMTRFFMKVEEAVDLVLYALEKMYGGEIFVPKCKAAYIRDVLKIRSGKTDFHIMGIRRGEKLHEVLVNRYEAMRTLEGVRYYVILPEEFAHLGHRYEYPDTENTKPFTSEDVSCHFTEEHLRRFFNVEGD